MGPEFIAAVNLASVCGDGDWPVAGGLMDQSAWFLSLYQRLESEMNLIEKEKMARGS